MFCSTEGSSHDLLKSLVEGWSDAVYCDFKHLS